MTYDLCVTKQEAWNTFCLHVPHPSPKDDDSVLQELADKVERERTKKRTRQKPRMIQFVKERQKASKQSQPTNSILDESDKWEMSVDLKQKLVFPNIIQTTLRPDIVIWSDKDKCLVMVELTVP